MKTSELKQIIEDADLEFDDSSWDVTVRNHDNDVLAAIDKGHTGRLKIYYPELFSLNIYDNIVKYAQTTIEERKEQYIRVDIPLSAWKELNEETTIDRTSSRDATIRFGNNNGFEALYDVLSEIQDRYLEYKDAYDEAERQDTSH